MRLEHHLVGGYVRYISPHIIIIIINPCATSTPFYASTDTAGGKDYAVKLSTLKYDELNWYKWPMTECATYDFDCIFFMNKSGINFNKKGLKFARKPILLPERDACPTIFF